jgi:glycosyltransferase involved in cell wall biosynthesis
MQHTNSPLVSVILPCYNQAEYLPDALNSILTQTWTNFELIAVDDGATDHTPQILDEYANRFPQMRVIHQPNQKLPTALNTGFQAAKGDLLTWTSSDNMLLPSMLSTLVKALQDNPGVGLVYADWQVIDGDGKLVATIRTLDYDRFLLMRTNFINACFLYRRACQETVGLYDAAYLYAEDWEYWLRIARKFRMLRVPETLYQYRDHGGSLTNAVVKSQAKPRPGLERLLAELKSNRPAWFWSKVKLEWLRRTDPNGPSWDRLFTR